MKVLTLTLRLIGVVQIVLGLIFILIPEQFAQVSNLETVPPWVLWVFTMMGARFIGYGIGMFVTARNPAHNILWIDTMILIQIVDWIGTILYLLRGVVTLSQVSTAAFLPVIFVGVLLYYRLTALKQSKLKK